MDTHNDAEGHFSGEEIERKFLVREVPPDLTSHPHLEIIQGYVVCGEPEVRLRRQNGTHLQTIKSGNGLVRQETELRLTREQFETMWPLTESARLEKVRYEIPYGDHTILVDVYRGPLDGLVTAEVEFSCVEAGEAFTPPDWFGADITASADYKNSRLARDGLPPGFHQSPSR